VKNKTPYECVSWKDYIVIVWYFMAIQYYNGNLDLLIEIVGG
jgi:hypothetical protein